MRNVLRLLLFTNLLFSILPKLQAQFTAGNLTVFRAESASANNTAFSIIELSPSAAQASPVSTIAVNGTAGASALRTSGSATSTGYLANSNDGSLLCFTGHNTVTTSANANTITARGAGSLTATGSFSLAATYTGGSGNQTRCATTIDNVNYFIADQGGLYTNNSTAASPSGNFRSVKAFGGIVYLFQASASAAPVSTVSAQSGGTIAGLPGLANGSSNNQDFYMISSGTNGAAFDILYVLSATSGTAGSLSKYSLVSGSWVANGTYTTSFGGFGLAAAKTGSGASLYITSGTGATAANSVIKLTDAAGYNSGITITTANNVTLYTTVAGTTLKGIAFSPVATVSPSLVPLPSSISFGTVVTGNSSSDQTVTLTASNLNPASGTLTVTMPNSNFEVYNGSAWSNTATVAYSGNGATTGNIRIRFSPQSSGLQSGNVSVSGGGLSLPVTIAVSGTGDNNLAFTFSAAATPALLPPYVSGTINDPADPAAISGIITTVKENGTDIPATDYTISITSSNTTVVPNANFIVSKANGNATIKILPAAVGYSTLNLTLTKGADTKSLVVYYATSQSGTAAIKWPTGIADASAAVGLDNDYMVIANDETNSLYVYNRNASGLPLKTFDFNAGNILNLTDGTTGNFKEVDVEAVAISPTYTGRSYWLGSMSNSSSFNNKPNRDRIVAMDISGTGAGTSFANAGYYAGLRQQLIAWGDANGYNFTASAADGKDAKIIDGFNVEGAVFGPDNTTLYIGFRAPLVPVGNRTKAIIAPIQNFETWFNNGVPSGLPIIRTTIELDLGGRGIRDLIRLPNGTYIIIAGSYNGTLVPAVYRWTGFAADAPLLLTSFDLTGLNAEAVLSVNNGSQLSANKLQVICDNGDHVFYNDGVAAKDLPQDNYRKFISQVVVSAIDGVLPVRFDYFTVQRRGVDVQLAWKSSYEDNAAAAFNILRSQNGSDFARIGTVLAFAHQSSYSFTDLTAPDGNLYYRIQAKDVQEQSYLSGIRKIPAAGDNSPVHIYPNPVTGNLFSIVINQTGSKQLDIYNSGGTLYKRLEFTEMTKDIQTNNWPRGYYLLRIKTTDGNVITEKLVVQ